jgi:hypothetical protein
VIASFVNGVLLQKSRWQLSFLFRQDSDLNTGVAREKDKSSFGPRMINRTYYDGIESQFKNSRVDQDNTED